MHWSDEIAQRIIRKRPDKEEYVCAAGISPSGSIHIGNFRDIATAYFVCKRQKSKTSFLMGRTGQTEKSACKCCKGKQGYGEIHRVSVCRCS